MQYRNNTRCKKKTHQTLIYIKSKRFSISHSDCLTGKYYYLNQMNFSAKKSLDLNHTTLFHYKKCNT